MLRSLEVSERKRIKTSGWLLGSVVYEVMYHRWAPHGLGRVEHRHRKTFFVLDWGNHTGSGLYNPAQAHVYGGRHLETTLTRPQTPFRFPRKADNVEQEAQTLEGLFCGGAAALLARASSQEVRVCLPPPLPVVCGVMCHFNYRWDVQNCKFKSKHKQAWAELSFFESSKENSKIHM